MLKSKQYPQPTNTRLNWVRYLHGGILKEAVVRVEHLFGQEVEPLTRHTTIVQTHLTVKLNPQP